MGGHDAVSAILNPMQSLTDRDDQRGLACLITYSWLGDSIGEATSHQFAYQQPYHLTKLGGMINKMLYFQLVIVGCGGRI